MNDRHQFMLALFLLLATIGYGIFQWKEREALLIQADALSSEVINLTGVSKELTEDYQMIKSVVTADRETAAQELALVFPTTEDLTNLTRLFDDFAVKNNFESNPFFISSITYESVENAGDYRSVPVNLNVTTSKKNLNKFLEFVGTSGSLEGEVRLMSISEMGLTYPNEFGGTYDVRIIVNAYFSQAL